MQLYILGEHYLGNPIFSEQVVLYLILKHDIYKVAHVFAKQATLHYFFVFAKSKHLLGTCT